MIKVLEKVGKKGENAIRKTLAGMLHVGMWGGEQSLTPARRERYRRIQQNLFRKDYQYRQDLAKAVIARKSDKAITITEEMAVAKMNAGAIPEMGIAVNRALDIFRHCVEGGDARRFQAKKAYLIRIPIPKNDLNINSPFLRLALHPDIVAPVAEYLGVLPVLREVALLYSPNDVPLAELARNTEDYNSQYFHIDQGADRHMRIFMNVKEVKENSGPFHVLPGNESDKIVDYLGRSKFINRLTDDEFMNCGQKAIGRDPVLYKNLGPAGTMWYADSCRCWHFGSREGSESRLLLGFQYCHPFAPVFLPYPFQRYGEMLTGSPKLLHLAAQTDDPIEKALLGDNRTRDIQNLIR